MSSGYLPSRLAPLAAALALACPGGAFAQTVSVTTATGDIRIDIGKSASVPEDFPADVWLPDDQGMTRVERTGETTTLAFDVPVGDRELADAYAARMRAAGWRPAFVIQPASGNARAWEKDARAVVAAFTPTATGGTSVRLQLLPRR